MLCAASDSPYRQCNAVTLGIGLFVFTMEALSFHLSLLRSSVGGLRRHLGGSGSSAELGSCSPCAGDMSWQKDDRTSDRGGL